MPSTDLAAGRLRPAGCGNARFVWGSARGAAGARSSRWCRHTAAAAESTSPAIPTKSLLAGDARGGGVLMIPMRLLSFVLLVFVSNDPSPAPGPGDPRRLCPVSGGSCPRSADAEEASAVRVESQPGREVFDLRRAQMGRPSVNRTGHPGRRPNADE